MTHAVPPVVYAHLSAAIAALAFGGVKLARVKGTSSHAGTMKWTYVGGLVIAGAFTLVPGRLLGNPVWKGCWAC